MVAVEARALTKRVADAVTIAVVTTETHRHRHTLLIDAHSTVATLRSVRHQTGIGDADAQIDHCRLTDHRAVSRDQRLRCRALQTVLEFVLVQTVQSTAEDVLLLARLEALVAELAQLNAAVRRLTGVVRVLLEATVDRHLSVVAEQ